MRKVKEALMNDLLMLYYETPQEQRHDDAWFFKAMENEMRALKLLRHSYTDGHTCG